MRHAPELRIVRMRPPRALHVERDALQAAGYREIAPKKLAVDKLLGTLVRQASHRIDRNGASVIAAMTRPEDADGMFAGRLADFRRVVLSPAHVAPLLDALFEEQGDCVIAAVGEAAPYARASHEQLARSLGAHNRRYEAEIAELATAWHEPRPPAGASPFRKLVVEEKPGKSFVLALEEPTVKQAHKKWSAALHRGGAGDVTPYPGDVVDGWAACAAVVRREPAPHVARSFRAASVDVEFAAEALDLRQLSLLFDFAEAWFETASGQALGNARGVSLEIPSAAITGYARRDLLTRHPRLAAAHFDVTPFVLGWHPLRSLVDALARCDLPLLFIDTGDFPVVSLLGAWS